MTDATSVPILLDGDTGYGNFNNVRRLVRRREEEGGGIGEWFSHGAPDIEHMLQNAVERVFKLLDLPRRSDIDALSANLRRVADAIERWESARRAPPAPEPPAAPPAEAGGGAP
jgi:hypothetical protein